MQASGKTVHIVPVTINYDRVFELRNLANEMVSGETTYTGIRQVSRLVASERDGKLGRVTVIYGNPLNLREYLKAEGMAPLTAEKIDVAGLRLSERLLQKQQSASPVTLNMIVATLLLQSTASRLPLRVLNSNVR